MGKKNFIDRYDPFGAQIQRDEERLSSLAEKTEDSSAPEAKAPIESETASLEEPAHRSSLPPKARTQVAFQHDDEDEEEVQVPRRPAQPAARPAMASVPPKRRLSEASRPVAREVSTPISDFDRTEVSPRLKVTQAAFQDLEAALANFHRATGSQIHYSIATRALWGLLIQAEAQVQEELKKHPLGRLPSTRDKLAYAEYEERVKQAFAQAFRKLPRTIFQPIGTVESEES